MANNRRVITGSTRRNRVELFYEEAAAQVGGVRLPSGAPIGYRCRRGASVVAKMTTRAESGRTTDSTALR